MSKLTPSAVLALDQIVRNVRYDIETAAKRYAEERGDTEATPEDVADAATVIFESDCKHLLIRRRRRA